MKVKKLLKPSTILAMGLGLQLFLISLFLSGILDTPRLQRKPVPITGFVHLLVFDFLSISMIWMFEKVKTRSTFFRIPLGLLISSLRGLVSLALLLVGIYGLVNVLRALPQLPLADYFALGVRGYFRPIIPWGKGFTILHVALQAVVAWSMLFIANRTVKFIIVIVALLALIVYSSIYMSRIMLITPIVAIIVILLRQNYYNRRVTRRIIIFAICLFLFLVILQGIRGYETLGVYYTDSLIEWGVYRVIEYYVSTGLYSSHIAASPWFASTPAPRYFGTPELVNVGSLGQLLNQFGIAYPFVLITFWWIISRYWRLFDKGHPSGLLVYPFLVYYLLEVPRIFALTTTTGIVRFGLLILLGHLGHNIAVKGKKYQIFSLYREKQGTL